MTNDKDIPSALDDAQFGELIQHLEAEEAASRESTLISVDSFEFWIKNHPALRQMAIVESISQIGPAIIAILRSLFGLDRGARDATDSAQNSKADRS